MYYVGSARTPLALPIVSNLSKALAGDEASYTINLGVLPLPCPGHPDSIRYYVVIERAIESNHTDNVIRFEQFAKEFVTKSDEPVPLRLASEPLAKGVYILRLENGTVIDFYDDFARFLEEHILINSERLKFNLGKETISDISSRLSIPYSVARTCQVKVELLSVVDTAHALPIVDTVRQPADYLAELDMSSFADGPYRYRIVATDLLSDKVLYDSTIGFRKAAPVIVSGSRIARGDTLEVGGKKKDWASLLAELNEQLTTEKVVNERTKSSLDQSEDEKHRLEQIVDANKRNSIADIHGRVGIGFGTSAGDNFFIGIEASKPALSFDVSFGFLYGSVPYLTGYAKPQNFSQFTSSPKSLGFQLTWVVLKTAGGLIEPLVGVGYYGIWSQPVSGASASPAPLSSATLLSAQLGIACEPYGEMNGLGFSLAIGATTGLGLQQSMQTDISGKAYIRF
ncbi:MAG TPA: hypothetical protein VG537_05220 [Candidatus Kapabacteria bacterium]|nr:hypothetical protein [Candidatus Kapabacteria bacterium]